MNAPYFICIVCIVSALACTTQQPASTIHPQNRLTDSSQPKLPQPPAIAPIICDDIILQTGETLGLLMEKAKMPGVLQSPFLKAVEQQLPIKKIRPGLTLSRCHSEQTIHEFRLSKPNVDWFLRYAPDENERWQLSKQTVPLTRKTRVFALKVTLSIGEAVQSAQAHASLTPALAEVLAWDLDLRRDVKRNDSLKVLVDEMRLPNGDFLRYDHILAVQYEGSERQFAMYAFDMHGGEIRYFDESGASVERSLLSTPMRFVRISSTFSSKRKHPILGYTKAHNGVDYAAPTGTPIWSVGRGRVTYAGWKGANGKLIRIDHGNGITTAYAHLSQIMPGIKRGARVAPKQIIGKVGTTGRSTGPHLHFAMRKHGQFVNPLKVKRPRLRALPRKALPKFSAEVKRLNQLLSASDSSPKAHQE